eukprot:TRINITY_DN49029_c0_g2_i3.p1 TRINITY_DN49029_c0_g2~~TRINITY_DN49029_c0_g2_i3.p1  ORF type:complete len:368 (-),score=75.57 TRINITY_DN49029_c0_g2_i3:129-1232(-)
MCIRDRYQRRVRGTPSNGMEASRYTPDEIQSLVLGASPAISRESFTMQEHIYFHGIMEKRAGNFTLKASWHDRYFILATVLLRTSPDPRGETIRCTGIFYFEIQDGNPFSAASMRAPVQGYFDLAYYCNVKSRTGKDPEYRYLTLIRSPEHHEDVKELRVRALKTNRTACRMMNAFRDVCIEHIRQCNPTSSMYQRMFDGELFADVELRAESQMVSSVPPELVKYAANWLTRHTSPGGDGGADLLGYISKKLDWILDSGAGPDDLQCIQAAKSVTGLMAAAARSIFRQEEENQEQYANHFKILQGLQEYQVRQLVELAVFTQGEAGERDRSISHFTDWIRNSNTCLLYTSDAADEEDSVDLGGRRII